HADMAGGGGFEPAPPPPAMQHRPHGGLARLHALERAGPAAGKGDNLRGIARREVRGVVTPAGKLPSTTAHHPPDAVRQGGTEGLDTEHGRIVDGVSLLRPRQEENGDVAAALGPERARQFNVEAASGFSHAILAASKSRTVR